MGILASIFTLIERVPVLAAQLGSPGVAVASPSPVTTSTSTTVAPTTTTSITVAPTTTTIAATPVFVPPPAAPKVATSGPWYEQVGQQALAMIHYPIASTGYTVRFAGPRAGYYGLTYPDTRTIQIYVRPGEAASYVARIIAHELGHAVDKAFNTDARRAQWQQLRGTHAGWWPCDACTDFSTGAGDYAETFAWWLVRPLDYRSTLAPPPNGAQLQQLAPLFNP